MAGCKLDPFTFKTKQIGVIKKSDFVVVEINEDLNSCAKINARTIDTSGISNLETPYYNAAHTPADAFGCSKNKCYNTGTFQGLVAEAGVGAEGGVTIGDFKKTMDATLYAVGLLTMYMYLPEGEHKISVDIADYTEAGWVNYETYSKTVNATKGDYLYPVAVNLTDAPEVEGNGWTPSTIGVKIRVRIDGTNLAKTDYVGVSSFAFYETVEALQNKRVAILSCLQNIGDNQSIDVVENNCATARPDPNSGSTTVTLTANKVSSNIEYANPFAHDEDTDMVWTPEAVSRTVNAGTGVLEGYGVIQLSDMSETGCGPVYVQTPGCANDTSELRAVSSPVPIISAETDTDKFQVLTSDFNGDASRGVILVAKEWIGQTLDIVYPREVAGTSMAVTNDIRDLKVRIYAPFRNADGTIEYHVYENALLTANAHSFTTSAGENRQFTFQVAADENGVRYRTVKSLE